jgi:adenosylhomocysteine nucleosidase
MSDPIRASDEPCIVFALHRESRPFVRRFNKYWQFPGAPCFASFFSRRRRNVLVLETGIGLARTKSALRWLLSCPQLDNVPYQPRFVLSAGFCGALQPDRKLGDIILADEVVDITGKSWMTTWADLPASELSSQESRVTSQTDTVSSLTPLPPVFRGRLLTTPGLIAGTDEKRKLGEVYAAAGVDMESAAVAEACTEAGIPFGCLRAVSDEIDTVLSPEVLDLLPDGRVSLKRVALTILRRASLLPELRSLARDTRHAAEQLGNVLGALVVGEG